MFTISFTERLDNQTMSIESKKVTRTNITGIIKKNMREIIKFCAFGDIAVNVMNQETGEVIMDGELFVNPFGRTELKMNVL